MVTVVMVMVVMVMVVMVMVVMVLQVEWERTDTYLVSAHSPDCIVRVWRSSTGELVSKLKVQEVKIKLNKARK